MYDVEDFFRNPARTLYSISPSGDYIAFLQPWKDRMNVHVARIDNSEVVRITDCEDRDVFQYHWANDFRIIYLRDTGGDENYRLWAVDADGNNRLLLTPQTNVSVQLIDVLADCPEEMLVALNADDARLHDAYRINISTGAQTIAAANPGNVGRWLADHYGNVRAAVTTDGVNTGILFRDDEHHPFRSVLQTGFKESATPLLFSFDNRHLYSASNIGRDKKAIVLLDSRDGQEIEVIYEDPDVDADALMHSRRLEKITGVSYTTWKRQNHFLDEERGSLQNCLESLFPDRQVSVVSTSRDEQHVIVHVESDKTMGAYYYHQVGTEELIKLAECGPWLDEAQMASMSPIFYQARDGLTIHGYLTIPAGMKSEKLPVVVIPHGGPWHRDTWGYNREVQFLASRGYAILQMNFRGSVGYGRSFWQSGFKQWGRAMQDDVSDGVLWLVDQGVADPRRVAIFGSSYGGYAALAGLAFTPELYACGIDYVGISNLLTFMNTIPPYLTPYLEMLYEMVGHPERDRATLVTASPVFHADRIRAPLLIAQGALDPRVNKAESDQMVEALRARGLSVPYLVKEDEGHGFNNQENRFEFYREVELFLAENL